MNTQRLIDHILNIIIVVLLCCPLVSMSSCKSPDAPGAPFEAKYVCIEPGHDIVLRCTSNPDQRDVVWASCTGCGDSGNYALSGIEFIPDTKLEIISIDMTRNNIKLYMQASHTLPVAMISITCVVAGNLVQIFHLFPEDHMYPESELLSHYDAVLSRLTHQSCSLIPNRQVTISCRGVCPGCEYYWIKDGDMISNDLDLFVTEIGVYECWKNNYDKRILTINIDRGETSDDPEQTIFCEYSDPDVGSPVEAASTSILISEPDKSRSTDTEPSNTRRVTTNQETSIETKAEPTMFTATAGIITSRDSTAESNIARETAAESTISKETTPKPTTEQPRDTSRATWQLVGDVTNQAMGASKPRAAARQQSVQYGSIAVSLVVGLILMLVCSWKYF